MHSYEEDAGDVEVYRSSSYSFPPSRGRKGFELRENGEFVERGIGPDDGPTKTVRRWETSARDQVEVYDGDKRAYVLEIVSASKDVLEIRMHK